MVVRSPDLVTAAALMEVCYGPMAVRAAALYSLLKSYNHLVLFKEFVKLQKS